MAIVTNNEVTFHFQTMSHQSQHSVYNWYIERRYPSVQLQYSTTTHGLLLTPMHIHHKLLARHNHFHRARIMPNIMTKLPLPPRATEAVAQKMDATMTKLPFPARATEAVARAVEQTMTKLPVARSVQGRDETMTKLPWAPRATKLVGRNVEKMVTVVRDISPIEESLKPTLNPGAGSPSKLTTKEIMFWIVLPIMVFVAICFALMLMFVRMRKLKAKDEEARIAETRMRYLATGTPRAAQNPVRVFEEVPLQDLSHVPAAK